tara:strand:+ start:23662 stop:30225 length:6564 start_codon:yes stop_codon:yes gene_type:complete
MSTSNILLGDTDRDLVLRQWNATDKTIPQEPVPLLFERLADSAPGATAVICGDASLSYGELNTRANQLAHHLVQLGCQRGDVVAMLHQRTPDMVVAMMAILKTGACYVPIDTQYPDDRISYILEDSGAKVLITQAGLAAKAAGKIDQVVLLDECDLSTQPSSNPGVEVSQEDRFYMVFTSGSTGRPKGCINFYRGVSNLYHWVREEFSLNADSRMLMMTSVGFDLTQKSIFAPLISGGTAVLLDSEVYDAALILDTIERDRVTLLSCTPTGLFGLLDDANETTFRQLSSITGACIAGEALPYARIAPWLRRPDFNVHFVNACGPSECSDLYTYQVITPSDLGQGEYAPIGKPLPNMRCYIVDDRLRPVGIGEKGELCVSGAGVGGGYLNMPDKTAEVFVPNPFEAGTTLYRSGDLVSYRESGVIEYHGRIDHLVKVGGYRIELSEVETALTRHSAVRAAVVTAPTDAMGDRILAAYVQLASEQNADVIALREYLEQRLPEFMVPSAWTFLDEFPLTSSGKIDRMKLPKPTPRRPSMPTSFRQPMGPLEERIAVIWRRLLGYSDVGADDRFFEAGGSSLKAIQFVSRMGHALEVRLPIAQFFANPTITSFSRYLQQQFPDAVSNLTGSRVSTPHGAKQQTRGDTQRMSQNLGGSGKIAIIGMSGRFPGAKDVSEFWENVLAGRSGLGELSDEELQKAGVSAEDIADPNYVRTAGWVEHADCFDAAYFGTSPREASLIDPQQRLMLEAAVNAMEHAGCDPQRYEGRIGVYAGVARNQYFSSNLSTHPEYRGNAMDYTLIGNDKDYVASRIAFKLDLHGPAVSVQNACSSSGVATHIACQALRTGDCDLAIVGGASVPVPFKRGYLFAEGGPLSRDGRIRPFDEQASGMVLTAGVGCLVLKRLEEAQADGDTVYAVIAGSAINNDGADKVAFTAPSAKGQATVIQAALQASGLLPEQVSYVEAHGTGTPLGDPIEITGLNDAYVGAKKIALGSVKANIGHLDAGAAAAGLIKTAMMLHERVLPPLANFENANPDCGFDGTPFTLSNARQAWDANGVRVAGVSSFGFGGTNFHALLEEAPKRESSPAKRALQVLRLSAKTEAALKQQAEQLAEWLEKNPEVSLADVAFSLDRGRTRHAQRAVVLAQNNAQAAEKLRGKAWVNGSASHPSPSLVFMFPGQGAQHVGMGRHLYETETVFRAEVDRCADILKPLLNLDLRKVLYPAAADAETAAETLRATQLAQPAIFTISYATAKLWQSWGLEAQHMIGHSVGEFVAATLAGVFELEDALSILAERARLMQSMPAGGMLAVRVPEEDARKFASEDVAIAGVNSPKLTVLSGTHAALDALKAKLDEEGIGTITLHTSHAFHSSMMEPVMAPFAEIVGRFALKIPQKDFYSSLTGKLIEARDAQDPEYWARQLRNAVRFAPGISELAEQTGCVFLECGPGQNLSTSTRQILSKAHQAQVIASLPHAGAADANDAEHFSEALGRLWMAGIEVPEARFYAGETRCVVGLPGYPFARTRHFIEADLAQGHAISASSTQTATADPLSDNVETAHAADVASSPVDQARVLATQVFVDVTGIEMSDEDRNKTFLELGCDSLLLTQVAAKLKNAFNTNIRFRQLLEDFTTLDALAEHLAPHVPAAGMSHGSKATAGSDAIVVSGAGANSSAPGKPFGAGTKIRKEKQDKLCPLQRRSLDALIERYIARSSGSKASAAKHRAYLADPRTVSGFTPLWKEIVYPIVSTRSDGAYVWDVDGNQYIDVLNGFGSTFFGHKPEFVNQAIREQLERGYEIGPIQDFIGEAAERFTRMVKLPRVAFCNTGSEAVSAAVRCARTVTGKDLVVSFVGDYHGIHDEVIVRPGPQGRGLPAASGIPNSHVANTLILEYGDPASLEILKSRVNEVAAILIEPVQSRKLELQPREFMHACREIATQADCALIMDEVITGFRSAPGGAQEYFGVKADLASYGKVFGGGMPIGAVAGISKYMDALDGGHWQFGDESMPEVGVTYFAGTFVRHPINMAAVLAVLKHLEANPNVQAEMNARNAEFVGRIRDVLTELQAPLRVNYFSSIWRFDFTQDEPFGELFYYYLRERGLQSYDGRLAVMTTAHTDEILEQILAIYRDAIICMQAEGLLGRIGEPVVMGQSSAHSGSIWYQPPKPGARVGRDEAGNPGWYVPDPEQPGRFQHIGTIN